MLTDKLIASSIFLAPRLALPSTLSTLPVTASRIFSPCKAASTASYPSCNCLRASLSSRAANRLSSRPPASFIVRVVFVSVFAIAPPKDTVRPVFL